MRLEIPAGLYVHVPFCLSKCAYCDFASYSGLDAIYADYVEATCQEARLAADAWRGTPFDTLFVGGGTPTALPAESLLRLLACVRDALGVDPNAEMTVEANPGTVDVAYLRALRDAGVNRLSLGVQSLHDDELALLGRAHNAQEAVGAVEAARDAGFSNLSLDFIFGLPKQSPLRWQATLDRALALRPEHLSLYALTLEAGTPLAQRIARGDLPAVDDDVAADMYEYAEDALIAEGYAQYEISNWARRTPGDEFRIYPGLACRHNLKYWQNGRYLGLGSAAYSYDGCRRYGNMPDPRRYVARVRAGESAMADEETPDTATRMGETMMLGLRLVAGVRRKEFEARYGVSLDAAYAPVIARLAEDGLLAVDSCGVRLTRRGRLLGNRVFREFLPD